jgi:predicted dehydrogenase
VTNQQPKMGLGLAAGKRRPRLGFLGVGWIGLNRMEAMARSGLAEVAAIAEPVRECAEKARGMVPGTEWVRSLDELLRMELDGVVIATPSALHAEQSMAALENGLAVFCQKPLGRTAAETRQVLEVSRRANRLLGVDLSYRGTAGARKIRDLVRQGGLGRVFAADLVFHNAYGPDKAWFYDPLLSGGGCVMDLGIHLADLALWTLGFPRVHQVKGRLYAGGELLRGRSSVVEDYATAQIELETGATVQMSCSWKVSAGCDAVISASFYGTEGGAALRNVNGSFYDFVAEQYRGTKREVLAEPPDEWGGRAALEWVCKLSDNPGFDPEQEHLVQVALVLDAIYDR